MISPDHIYTLEEYWKLVDLFPNHKYEYIHGHIRMMSRGSPSHSQIGGNVVTALNNALRSNKSECIAYNSDISVQLKEGLYYHPDAAVSCDPHDWGRENYIQAPTVVVEVLSPSNQHIDTGEKLQAYQRYPTIQDILLIHSQKCYIAHYQRMGASRWQCSIYEHEEEVIDISSIEIQLAVHDIYERIF